MRRAFLCACAALAISGVAPARAAAPAPAAAPVSAGMPAEFAALSQTQHAVADAWFGGRRIGQFEIDAAPDSVTVLHPDQLAAVIPDLVDRTGVTQALSGRLDPNARSVCADAAAACVRPQPPVAAIIYDARRFRFEVVVNPHRLAVRGAATDRFLDPFTKAPTLVDTLGVALAGGGGQSLAYNVRNRAVLGFGAARLVSEVSVSSSRGLNVDTLATQLDRPDIRYQAGLFYAPGADLVGRRRLLGIGVGSQLDTRADRLALTGNPLVIFLPQRSRVDVFVAGRLIGSHTFEAGNQLLDTSSLPDGSYPVEIRIQEAGGAIRTEQRFFTKSAVLPPVGRVLFHVEAGLLAIDRPHRWLSLAGTPLLTAGAAGRFGAHLAWDGALMATDGKALVELGGSLLTRIAQVRLAVLGSSAGDHGYIAQIGSSAAGGLSYNLDLRHVRARDGRMLIPVDAYINDGIATLGAQPLQSSAPSFTQAIGNLSYNLAGAQIGVSGYYRRDRGRDATYALGPTMRWSVLRRDRVQLTLNGSYAATNYGRSFAAGLQLQILGRRSAISASLGVQTGSDSGRRAGDVEEVAASIQRENVLGGQFAGSAAVTHGTNGTVVQVSADQRSRVGYAAISLVDRLGGAGGGLQYGLTGQTAIAIGHHTAHVGTRDQNDSIIAVGVRGDAGGGRFDVMIDDAARGSIGAGEHLAIAVTPYRRYTVRLRAVGDALVAFDTQARTVDVYPGTVATLDWKATSVLAMFGRLVHGDGSPIANADIVTEGAIAATDDRGYFQVQAASDARLTVHEAGGLTCTTKLDAKPTNQGYSPLGDITCAS